MKYPDIQSKYNLVDEQGLTYTVEVPAADKIIGRCDSDREKAILVAKRPEKNEKVIVELEMLKALAGAGAPVLPVLSEVFYVDYLEGPAEEKCAAFCVKWIDGPHSKVDKPDFERALADNKGNITLRGDFEKLRKFITEDLGVGDLQLMFESETGRLYIIDPRDIVEPRPDDPLIRRCRELILENARPSQAASYKKAD
jgi:hypothetical protein